MLTSAITRRVSSTKRSRVVNCRQVQRQKRTYSTNVIQELTDRGLLNAVTSPKISDIIAEKPSLYCGYDPTADCLHVGHLLSIITMHHMKKAGVRPIALVGGATGLIGDPSGRTEERPLITEEQVQHNLNGIQKILENTLGDVKVVNNYEWYKDMKAIDFLRNIGKHFRLGTMLSKDSVKSRMGGDGISFTEFSYQLLQGYDFYHLHKYENCKIQLGGSDQWGNITAGIDLIGRMSGQDAYGITIPLLTTAAGVKISKSMGNATWLSADRDSPFDLYQNFMRMDDADMEPMLKRLTFIPLPEIDQVLVEHNRQPEQRIAHKLLASHVTQFVHGERGVEQALAATNILFGGKITKQMQSKDVLAALGQVGKIIEIPRSQVIGNSLLQLTQLAGMGSKGELRRLMEGNGFYLNNTVVSDKDLVVAESDVIDSTLLVLRTGKKNYHIVKLV